MAENGQDFVVYPKDYEERRMEQNETPLDLSQPLITPPPPPPPLSPLREVLSETIKPESLIAHKEISTNKKRKPKPKASEYDEKVIRIAKLALLLAKNDAYNMNLEVKNRDGQFVPGSNVAKFFKFATHHLRKLDYIDDYVHQILALNQDVTGLISNPTLIHKIGLVKAENEPSTSDGIEREGPIDQTEIVTELKNSDRPTPVERGVKRTRSEADDMTPLDLNDDTLWTTVDPKKFKQNQQVGEGNQDWITQPELDKAVAEIFMN